MRRLIIAAPLLALLAVHSVGWAQEAPSPSQAVIQEQIEAFRAGEHDRAFSYAAPSIKQIFGGADRFITMVKKGYLPIYAARSWSFGRSKVEGGATYHEVLISGPEGKDWVALYTMKQQPDGSWKITGVQLLKGAGETT